MVRSASSEFSIASKLKMFCLFIDTSKCFTSGYDCEISETIWEVFANGSDFVLRSCPPRHFGTGLIVADGTQHVVVVVTGSQAGQT